MHAKPEAALRPSAEDERFIQELLREDAATGERRVALIRAYAFSGFVAVDAFLASAGRQDVPAWLRPFLPLVAATVLGTCWGWYFFVRRRVYRPVYGRISAAVDAILLSVLTFGAMFATIIQGSGPATTFYVGAAPLSFFFVLALVSAGLRQDPIACLLTGAISIVATGVSAAVVGPHADPRLLAAMGPFPAGEIWLIRGVAFTASTVLVALTARHARLMAYRMGREVAERSKVVQLFGKYVEPEIARDVIAAGGQTRAETVEVTVLFTDLRGFTALSERLSPDAVLELLNAHYQAIVPAVHAYGGTVNKFIGDAIMATFGAPLRQGNHAERAVRAALQMLEAMEALNVRLRARGLPELEMGIGVSTGPVVVGTLGASQRVEYAVIGDTVNTASRLESLNKELHSRLLLSAATRDALAGAVPTRALGDFPVKGKARPVPVFTVEGLPALAPPG